MPRFAFIVAALAGGVLAVPAQATPPGQNGMVVWQRESSTAPPHLWIANPDGSAARRVFGKGTEHGEVEGTFSPVDPNVLFFTRFGRRPFSEDLFSGDLTTGATARVTRAPSADVAPTVSPDGARLAYFAVPRPKKLDSNAPPPPERIHIANVDGTDDHAITPRNQRSGDPDWSPDGTQLVYMQVKLSGKGRRLTADQRLVVVNADGSGRRALTAFGGRSEVNAKWMPDGRTIVFETIPGNERTTRSDIVAITSDGATRRTILATKAWETNPVPSPDGTRILFTSDRDRRGDDLGRFSGERLGPGFELYTMAPDGSDIRRLTTNRKSDLFPDWQRLPGGA